MGVGRGWVHGGGRVRDFPSLQGYAWLSSPTATAVSRRGAQTFTHPQFPCISHLGAGRFELVCPAAEGWAGAGCFNCSTELILLMTF